MTETDPYEVLGVRQDATIQDIKKAYKHLALKLHPDKLGENPRALEQMKLVNEAYAILKNKGIRDRFDEADDWDKDSTAEDREKVWIEYSEQVEEYYRKCQEYVEKEAAELHGQKERLSRIEVELRKKEESLLAREREIEKQVEAVNRFASREKQLEKREKFIARREKDLDDLLLYISKSYSLVVELGQASRELKSK